MEKWLYRLSIVAAVIGMAIGAYMAIYKITDNASMCLGSGGCDIVNHSVYSLIYGIPMGVFGFAGNAAILAMLVLEKKGGEYFKKNATMLTFGMALTGFLFILYLVYLELFVIKAICPFCVAAQISMTVLFILSVIRLIQQPADLGED